jgi:hypothetical protein
LEEVCKRRLFGESELFLLDARPDQGHAVLLRRGRLRAHRASSVVCIVSLDPQPHCTTRGQGDGPLNPRPTL